MWIKQKSKQNKDGDKNRDSDLVLVEAAKKKKKAEKRFRFTNRNLRQFCTHLWFWKLFVCKVSMRSLDVKGALSVSHAASCIWTLCLSESELICIWQNLISCLCGGVVVKAFTELLQRAQRVFWASKTMFQKKKKNKWTPMRQISLEIKKEIQVLLHATHVKETWRKNLSPGKLTLRLFIRSPALHQLHRALSEYTRA